MELSEDERSAVDRAVNHLLVAYNSDDHTLIHEHIGRVNDATMKLAENMMNTAVRGVLKGTKTMTWDDTEDIGIALHEKNPATDPLTARFTDLRSQVSDPRRFR